MTVYLLLVLSLFSSSQAQANWQAIETTSWQWEGTNRPHTLILETRGDECRLRVETFGQPELVVPIANGVVRLDNEIVNQKLIADNLMKSSYFYLSPKLRDQSGRPMLLVFNDAIASDPGGVHIVALDRKNLPVVVFSSDAFELLAITDIDHDKHPELVGVHCLSQSWGTCFSTYDPYSVYRFSSRSGKAVLSVPLSRKYNLKHYYGWAGPGCSEEIAVVRCAPKGKPRVMSAERAKRLYETKAGIPPGCRGYSAPH
ncbi:MAG TPA: hypothetical protein VF290_19335 [Pyrinomonadaceae bacterium]